MEKHVKAQVLFWELQKESVDYVEEKKQAPPFLTLSREYGTNGYEIAESIITIINEDNESKLPWAAYDRKLLNKIMEDMGLSEQLAATLTGNARKKMTDLFQTSFSSFPPQVAVYRKLAETIRLLAINGNVAIVGRAGNRITRDMKSGYHVRIVAPTEWRINNLKTKYEMTRKEAETLIKEKAKARSGFMQEFVKFDTEDSHNFDMVINIANHSKEEVSHIIIEAMKSKGILSR